MNREFVNCKKLIFLGLVLSVGQLWASDESKSSVIVDYDEPNKLVKSFHFNYHVDPVAKKAVEAYLSDPELLGRWEAHSKLGTAPLQPRFVRCLIDNCNHFSVYWGDVCRIRSNNHFNTVHNKCPEQPDFEVVDQLRCPNCGFISKVSPFKCTGNACSTLNLHIKSCLGGRKRKR
jgi:hypothetical protein